MTKEREVLLDRMIKIYGYEHEITIDFADACENKFFPLRTLETIVKCHEAHPVL